MSEQKNPNDINFDDEFLNIELDSVHTDVNSDTDSALDADFDELFNKTIPVSSESSSKPDLGTSYPSDDLTLDGLTSDAFGIHLNDTLVGHDITSGGIDLSKIIDDPSQHNPSEVSLSQAPNTADNTPHLDGTDAAAALLGATALAGISASTSSNDSDSNPSQEGKPTKKAGLFGKKDVASKATKPAKTKISKSTGDKGDFTGLLNNPQKLNKMILGGVIALILVGLALYMAMSGNESTPTNATPTPVNTPAPATNAEVAPTPQTQTETVSDVPTSADDNILPEIKPVVNPDEILNAEIPNDPTLIKEEIDRLADKEAQIAEQEKLIQDQLTMMEDMTTAKAEHIALLEAQIAELEKQKGNTSAEPATQSK